MLFVVNRCLSLVIVCRLSLFMICRLLMFVHDNGWVLGQQRVVLDGTWWYLVSMGLSDSIWRRKINGDTDRPTDRPTDRGNIVQSAFLRGFEGFMAPRLPL